MRGTSSGDGYGDGYAGGGSGDGYGGKHECSLWWEMLGVPDGGSSSVEFFCVGIRVGWTRRTCLLRQAGDGPGGEDA